MGKLKFHAHTALIYVIAGTAILSVGGLTHLSIAKMVALAFVTVMFLAAELALARWGTRRR